MEQGEILSIIQQGIYTIIITSAPLLAVALIIGIIVSIFQATTQINEQTMVFVPKIVGVFLALILLGGWIMTNLTEFTKNVFESINTMIR